MININDLPLNIQSKIKVLGDHWIWIGDLSGTGGPIVYFNGNNKATLLIGVMQMEIIKQQLE